VIGREIVLHVARLAYLELDEARLEALPAELGAILEHVRAIDALDLTGVEPTSHGVPLPPLFREDQPGQTLDTERALAGAPERSNEAFSVPKIVE
jgi:aspartyl-tRNA(Asn)/glutamyl-tRNA(Gln) amidotransferase subunit C